MQFNGIVKGDTINLECSIDLDSGQTLTGWKIRCEIGDNKGTKIKLATANSGGSNNQIEITNVTDGDFTIKIAKTLTANLDRKSYIEIEVENSDGEIFTPIAGEDNEISFKNQKITWTAP